MKSNKPFNFLVTLVIFSMALAACMPQNQNNPSGISNTSKDNMISVTMDQLELGQTFFVGKVTEVAKDSVTIQNVVFRIDRNSAIPGGLMIGDVVSVDGLLLPDQTRYAASMQMRSVAAMSSDDSSNGLEFKLYGIVESMDSQVWVVSGETINIADNAFVETGIQVGNVVEVEGFLVNGALRANKISKEDSPSVAGGSTAYPAPTGTAQPSLGQEFEFYGTIQSIQSGVWTIAGRQVQVTNQTEIKGTLDVGDNVKVHTSQQTDGSLIAREIELAGDDDGDDDNSGSGSDDDGDDDNSGSSDDDGDDDNSGSGSDDDGDDDNSGSGSDDDGDDDNSGSGSDDDGDDDNSGSDSDDDGDDDNSGSGSDDNGDDDNSGSSDDDGDDDNSGSGDDDDDDDKDGDD